MKLKILPLLVLLSTALACPACDKHDHDHKHDHKDGHKHDGEDGHSHDKQAGPNGGRVLHDVDPHAEFLVLEDRKVRITFLGDDLKPVAAGDQVVSVIAGDRSDPTELTFKKDGDVLVSDKALPASDNFPVIVMIAPKKDADEVIVKFQADMRDCPSCDYLEYACICDHGDDGHADHDH